MTAIYVVGSMARAGQDGYRELFDRLLLAASAEDLSVRVHKPDEPNWFETGEKNLGNFMLSANNVASLIRLRTASLAVMPKSS